MRTYGWDSWNQFMRSGKIEDYVYHCQQSRQGQEPVALRGEMTFGADYDKRSGASAEEHGPGRPFAEHTHR